MRKHLVWFLGILLVTLACTPEASPEQPPSNLSDFVTVTPSPVPSPSPPTPTPLPEETVPYAEAMKPTFAADITEQIQGSVSRYEIQASLHLDSLTESASPTLSGSVRVHYTNRESVLLNQVYFRLFPNTPGYGGSMTVTQVLVDNQPVQTALASADSALFVPFQQALEPGDSVEIFLAYEATIPTETGQGNGIYSFDNDTLSLAGFYPIIPVFDDQGWHLGVAPIFADAAYTDIALYDVTLTVPEAMVVATTGNIVQTTPQADGSKTVRAVSGPVRDFFVAMSPAYQQVTEIVDGTLITSYFPTGFAEQGEVVLQIGANALATFSQHFGPYPYQELDLITAPMPLSLGGVEYPGIVVVADRYFYGDDQFMEFVTAHEVAHQWWYGLVGNDQVSAPWLDEALTQYTTIHYYEARYGPDSRQNMIDLMFIAPYQQYLNFYPDQPVVNAAGRFDQMGYLPIIYGKGPLFFEDVRTQLGDDLYFAALRQYATQYRYEIATAEDLLNVIETVSNQDINELYQIWILGE